MTKDSATSLYDTSHVGGCKVHDPVEPLPEGEVPVWQRLPTELRPRDHQGLEVVRREIGVPVTTV